MHNALSHADSFHVILNILQLDFGGEMSSPWLCPNVLKRSMNIASCISFSLKIVFFGVLSGVWR